MTKFEKFQEAVANLGKAPSKPNPNNNTMDRSQLLAGLLESAAVDGAFKLIVKDGQLMMIDLFDEVEPFAVEFSGGDDVQDRFHDLAVTKILTLNQS